jgi:hypothetical protein
MLRWYLGKPSRSACSVDESGVEQCRYEVPVFFTEAAESFATQVFLVEAPPGVLRITGKCSGVAAVSTERQNVDLC